MNVTDLPTTKRGQIAWSVLFAKAPAGTEFRIECEDENQAAKLRSSCTKCMRYLGIPYTSLIIGTAIVMTVTDGKRGAFKRPDNPELRQAIRNAEARSANLPGRIHEADTNAAYWQRQITLRLLPEAREQAVANHAAWKMTAARLRNDLNTRQLATA